MEEGQAPAGEEAFGPVVRVGGAVPAAHGKKAEKAVKAEAQAAPEAEKDVWAHPAKNKTAEQTTFAEDLTIEPDEYELPDDEAPFDVPPSGKKPLPKFKKGAPAPEEEDEEAGLIILKVVDVDGEEQLATLEDEEELDRVYQQFMESLFEDEEE